nr:cytochrome c biogenesis CcdA family protein [Spelaeicoccus albus]
MLGGVISLLSPCSVMLLPAFFAYAFAAPAKLLGRTGVFYLGLVVTLVPLGVFSSALGSLAGDNRYVLVRIVAIVVMVAGLVQLSGLPIPGLRRTESAGNSTSAISVFFLGAVYAVAGVCAGPILGSVLMVAAIAGNAVYGGVMLAIYALGMTVPLFVLALVWNSMGMRGRALVRPRSVHIGRWRNTWLMIVSGILSIGVGILLLVTNGTADFGGFFSVGTQYKAESWVSNFGSTVSNYWFIGGAAVVLAGVAIIVRLRNRPRRRDSEAAKR